MIDDEEKKELEGRCFLRVLTRLAATSTDLDLSGV
jgi:hypothetical protein